jgi:hypothetical protein
MTCRSKDFAVEKTITGQLGGLVIGSGLHWSGTVRVKPSLDPVSCVTGVALLARRAHARAPRPFAKQHGTAAAQRAPVRGSTWNGSDGAVHDQGRWQANAQYDGAGKRRRQQQNRAGTRQGRWVVACTGSGYSGDPAGGRRARAVHAPLSPRLQIHGTWTGPPAAQPPTTPPSPRAAQVLTQDCACVLSSTVQEDRRIHPSGLPFSSHQVGVLRIHASHNWLFIGSSLMSTISACMPLDRRFSPSDPVYEFPADDHFLHVKDA